VIVTLDGRNVGNAISIPVPVSTKDGSYILSWRVVSADGHPIAGTLEFSIGTPSANRVVVDQSDPSSMLYRLVSVIQGLGYVTVLAVLGLAMFRHFVLPETELSRQRWGEVSVVLAALAVTFRALELPISVLREEALPLSRVVDVRHWLMNIDSNLWIASIAIIASVALADMACSVEESPTSIKHAVALVVICTAAALSLVGHTRVFQPTWLVVASNMTHIVVAAFWVGGLLGLGLFLRGGYSNSDTQNVNRLSREAVAVIARFSGFAVGAVGLLVLSGSFGAWRILPDLESLRSIRYGQLLLVKIGITVLLIMVAAWNRYRLVPAINRESNNREAWERLRTAVRVELTLLVAVVLATGFLVNQSPQASATLEEAPVGAASEITWEVPLGTALLIGNLEPGAVGQNQIVIRVMDGDGQTLVPADTPVVRFRNEELDLGPFEAILTATEEGGSFRYVANVPLAGEWSFEFIVRMSRFEEPIAKTSIMIE
jgi:copper transport protein